MAGLVIGLLLVLSLVALGLGAERPPARAEGCWQAEIVEQWTHTDLVGSVLWVSVEGIGGLPVFVRSTGGYETVQFTGSKPEQGPNVAEFAPLSKGTYYVEPQGLGTVFEIWLDGQSYNRVHFRPLACAPTATPTATTTTEPAAPQPQGATATPRPTATPTASPAGSPASPPVTWHGREAERISGLETHFATIAVRVIGRPAGQDVEIHSAGWSEICKTGTKPEHGPDACEFGALNAGTYRLAPTGLDTVLEVTVDLHQFVLVEFTYSGGPETYWAGSVVENTSGDQPTEHANSAIAVIVSGRPWHEVEIRANDWTATCETGYKPEYGPDACEFGGLRAGTFTITPKDLEASVEVTVDGWGWAKVRFDEVVAPPPSPSQPSQPTATPVPARPSATPTQTKPSPTPTATAEEGAPQAEPTAKPGWQGWVISNTSGEQGNETGAWSVIVVRVINYGGLAVQLYAGGNLQATCVTGTKPEYGPDACEFSGLSAATYLLQPEGADIELEVEMDGLGRAEIHFAPP
jgi:hypothetical protein